MKIYKIILISSHTHGAVLLTVACKGRILGCGVSSADARGLCAGHVSVVALSAASTGEGVRRHPAAPSERPPAPGCPVKAHAACPSRSPSPLPNCR